MNKNQLKLWSEKLIELLVLIVVLDRLVVAMLIVIDLLFDDAVISDNLRSSCLVSSNELLTKGNGGNFNFTFGVSFISLYLLILLWLLRLWGCCKVCWINWNNKLFSFKNLKFKILNDLKIFKYTQPCFLNHYRSYCTERA